MAERLADVTARIQSVDQLEAVVTAMRGIAASRARQSGQLIPGIEAYCEVVSRAIGQALPLLPEAPRHGALPARRGVLVFCAEQGFAGAFSERILDGAAPDLTGASLFIVGTRGATQAAERKLDVAWSIPMATGSAGVPALADRIAEELYARVAAGRINEIALVFPRAGAGGEITIDRHSLLPVDLRRFRAAGAETPPLTLLPADLLVERLVEEYVYGQLCQAAMHAFEAENAARMAAMSAARSNIADQLSALEGRERQLRQEQITAEIIELAAGAEAQRKGKGKLFGPRR